MSVRKWQIREATERDVPALCELFHTVFGTRREEQHNRWKFYGNPDGPPIIFVADHDGQLVGQSALWPTRLRLGTSVVMGAQALDGMTHPDYRGQSIFKDLSERAMEAAADRGLVALYGFPNEFSLPVLLKADWARTGLVSRWVRVLTPSRIARIPAFLGPLADLASTLLPSGSLHGLQMTYERPTDAELESLLEGWRRQERLCRVERDRTRMDWRFSPASQSSYEWVCARSNQMLAAVAIWSVSLPSGNARLCELLGDTPEAVLAVVSATVARARAARCPAMHALSSTPQANLALKQCGFFLRPGAVQIVRKLTVKSLAANIHQHDNWHIFGADVDTY